MQNSKCKIYCQDGKLYATKSLFSIKIGIFVVMKRTLCILFALLGVAISLSAQQVEVGSKAPHISGVEWISDTPQLGGRFLMVEFFHSSNDDCKAHINTCNSLSHTSLDQMDVVMLTREPSEQLASLLMHEYQFFYVASDEEGTMFSAFGANHVPYAVIVNPKGVIVWTGNPWTLNIEIIENIITQ
jgi:hypothetical protein